MKSLAKPLSRFLSVFGLCLACVCGSTAPALAAPTPEQAKTPPPEATRRTSGLVTLVLEPGTGERKPIGHDLVVLHFTGWDRQGKQFMSSREGERPQPATSVLGKVFPGWREALELMVEGEMRRVWVPDHLGAESSRGPKSAVFDLELLEIRDLPSPPPAWTPSADAKRSPSGGHFQVIRPGTSDESPVPGGTVLLNWTLWVEDGRMLDSTEMRGRPTAFMLDNVFLGFAEVVQDMKVGEERYAWFPAAVHGGQWPNAPKDKALIFRLELVRLLPKSLFTPQQR